MDRVRAQKLAPVLRMLAPVLRMLAPVLRMLAPVLRMCHLLLESERCTAPPRSRGKRARNVCSTASDPPGTHTYQGQSTPHYERPWYKYE